MPISLGFKNIAITQNKNICKSRLDVDIKSEVIRGIFLDIPMIASNMSTVCNSEFIIKLHKLGALGIMHRAGQEQEILSEIQLIARDCNLVGASIGNGENQLDFAKKLIQSGANIICIDVAHGYNDSSIQLAKEIKLYSSETKIILGNVINPNIIYEVYDFVDALKVGIAQGFVCETKNTAGCTEKQFSAVHKFKYISREFGIPVISDGSIREPADFVKAIAAGANSIMAGKIFAACPESAAATIVTGEGTKKIYAGMSSRYIQNIWKGGLKKGTCSEGCVKYLDIGENVYNLLERYCGALRSGITYAGANNLKDFQDIVKFVKIEK
jgi:IMP dehydrogenase/GMP reductase